MLSKPICAGYLSLAMPYCPKHTWRHHNINTDDQSWDLNFRDVLSMELWALVNAHPCNQPFGGHQNHNPQVGLTIVPRIKSHDFHIIPWLSHDNPTTRCTNLVCVFKPTIFEVSVSSASLKFPLQQEVVLFLAGIPPQLQHSPPLQELSMIPPKNTHFLLVAPANWQYFWHVVWHSIWPIFIYIFWHSIWRCFWHFLTYICIYINIYIYMVSVFYC